MTRPFIVAEMSANHLGSLGRALKIVDAAADARADAIKVQTWSPDTMCVSDYKVVHGPWAGRELRDLYREAWLPWEWHRPIFDHAMQRGLIPFSAGFDAAAVDFLETLGVPYHKVASFELTDLPLIRHMAKKGKPMILSTGMATINEIEAALQATGNCPVTLLNCTSAYPADPAEAGLLTWADEPLPWGISDHTMGSGVACAAVALGASMVEKHLTLSRADGGPDAGFSMEPAEFAAMVTEVRRAAAASTSRPIGPKPSESPELRRSLWVTREVWPADLLVLGYNVATARPALGLPPSTDLARTVATRMIPAGTPLTADAIFQVPA